MNPDLTVLNTVLFILAPLIFMLMLVEDDDDDDLGPGKMVPVTYPTS